MTSEKAGRRRYSREFKAQVMAECDVPGASVAKVAMSHGINTNVVHGWRKSARQAGAVTISPQREFVPIQLEPPAVHREPSALAVAGLSFTQPAVGMGRART